MSKHIERIEQIIIDPKIHPKAADEELKDVFAALYSADEILHAEIPYVDERMYLSRKPEIDHRSYLLYPNGRPMIDQELHSPFTEKN